MLTVLMIRSAITVSKTELFLHLIFHRFVTSLKLGLTPDTSHPQNDVKYVDTVGAVWLLVHQYNQQRRQVTC